MKHIKLTFAVLAFLACTTLATAQTGTATLTKQGAINISAEQTLQPAYALDATNFNFKTEREAITYFADKQSEYVSYRPVFQNNQIMVYLQLNAKPEWTKSDWNKYLTKNKIQSPTTKIQKPTTNSQTPKTNSYE